MADALPDATFSHAASIQIINFTLKNSHMKNSPLLCALTISVAFAQSASAAPDPRDRVYTADQNSNTVSVISPVTNTLLGQIKLGNQRPDVLSPL